MRRAEPWELRYVTGYLCWGAGFRVRGVRGAQTREVSAPPPHRYRVSYLSPAAEWLLRYVTRYLRWGSGVRTLSAERGPEA
jgi:hypothetical protein